MPAPRKRARAASAAAPLSLSVRADSQTWERHAPFLRRSLAAAHGILRPALSEMSLALVGDRRMAELHERFMGIAGPTDVLTFPLETGAHGKVTEGEVVVCVPEARRRAREQAAALEHELLLYALHGMLHLCGYDDRTQRAYVKMHRTEDEILKRLGVGPVFAPPAARTKAPSKTRPSRRKRGRAR